MVFSDPAFQPGISEAKGQLRTGRTHIAHTSEDDAGRARQAAVGRDPEAAGSRRCDAGPSLAGGSDGGEPSVVAGLDAAGADDVFGDVSEFAVGVLADPA